MHDDEQARMVLVDHKKDVVDVFMNKLPSSTAVAAQEQMPRGANRVVNFKYDIDASPGCADHYELCKAFARNGSCDKKKHQSWMHQYCSLSCRACDKLATEAA
mmetsp:Transcript_27268/g.35138  ORF Transcript_27268/g.35138 Transcript_27268/m.35138 type:complete len:103 (+) Transcript_27268:1-309(+)